MSAGAGETWDEEFDFVVVGGGGGGMAAALTAADSGLSTVVIEKGARYGGSTGISGGGIWIPNNPTLRARGHDDSRESVRRYLDRLTGGRVPSARLDAYVDQGPAAMELLGASRWMRFFWVKGYADYHPEYEGAARSAGPSRRCPSTPASSATTSATSGPTVSRARSDCGSPRRTTATSPWSSGPGAAAGPPWSPHGGSPPIWSPAATWPPEGGPWSPGCAWP